MSGYYSDPVSDPAQRRLARASMTHTSNQTVFARTSDNLFKAVIGSPKTRPGSKFFIEGEYTFSYGPQENGSYLELTHLSFNSTHRSDTPTTSVDLPAGDSARRRNVKPKGKTVSRASSSSLPATPRNDHLQASTAHQSPLAQPQFGTSGTYIQAQQQVPGPQHLPQQYQQTAAQYPQPLQPANAGPAYFQRQTDTAAPYAGTSMRMTAASTQSPAGELPLPLAPAYQLDEFVDIDNLPSSQAPRREADSPSEVARGKRRAQDDEDDERPVARPMRNRRPTVKAAALQFLDTEAAEEVDEGDIEVSEDEVEEYL